MIAYGPVPSRRLGQSLGINNIPPKSCSYSCVYCQIGRTNPLTVERRAFYPPGRIIRDVETLIRKTLAAGEPIDYLSFVPDGEPTLDLNLGEEIQSLKRFGIPVAVITNGSLLWMSGVRDDLLLADWVSLKVDSADTGRWRSIDRPHGALDLERIKEGMAEFSSRFSGFLVTETMLADSLNDSSECLEGTGRLIGEIRPAKAYLLVPTRPPAESFVRKPSTAALQKAVTMIHKASGIPVECVTGDEGDQFFFTSDIEQDLINIASVHPIRERTIARLLEERGLNPSIFNDLLASGRIRERVYDAEKFYIAAHTRDGHEARDY